MAKKKVKAASSADFEWRDRALSIATLVGFGYNLPRGMLMYLSQAARVSWDVEKYGSRLDDRLVARARAGLVRRGMIELRAPAGVDWREAKGLSGASSILVPAAVTPFGKTVVESARCLGFFRPTDPTLVIPDWLDNARSYAIRVGFCVWLTKAMLEFLCAVDAGVSWDRERFGSVFEPDSTKVTSASLVKRGMIQYPPMRDREKIARRRIDAAGGDADLVSLARVTPFGKTVVASIKCLGLFHVSDNAVRKNVRGKK